MTHQFSMGLLACFLTAFPAEAQHALCDGLACDPLAFQFTSVSASESYGVVVTSPADIGCGAVQFIVSDGQGGVLGRSHALRADEVQVVRIGRGYAVGRHALHILASGCPVQPASVRPVRVGKSSPDHGWRAAAVMQVHFTP